MQQVVESLKRHKPGPAKLPAVKKAAKKTTKTAAKKPVAAAKKRAR